MNRLTRRGVAVLLLAPCVALAMVRVGDKIDITWTDAARLSLG